MKNYLFFDHASTTACCEGAIEAMTRFFREDYGNPSSSHALGQSAFRAVRAARLFFAEHFGIQPEQVVFTSGGTEADNLAITGTALRSRSLFKDTGSHRVIIGGTEHPAVSRTAHSLTDFGFDVVQAPVNRQGQPDMDRLVQLITPDTILTSMHLVNNLTGAKIDVEAIADRIKRIAPDCVFHSDAVQGFGRIPTPRVHSSIDLLSLSAHKIGGPKGIGALIILNPTLLKSGLRPILFGGDQEGGLRSGTVPVALIAGFHAAAREALAQRESSFEQVTRLHERLHARLAEHNLLSPTPQRFRVTWNSPSLDLAVPHIVNLSVPGCPAGPLARCLEERGCLVATGSACDSARSGPDPILLEMGLGSDLASSAIRISFSHQQKIEDIDFLALQLEESINVMRQLYKGGR